MDILEPGDPNNPASRARASYIRRKVKRGTATEDEADWLKEFESQKQTGTRGASASRRESYTLEESAAAGTGDAAVVAASAAMVREEGVRVDSLADRGIRALERAFSRQERLVEFMMARMQTLEDSHLAMWAAHRDSRIREVDAEIELMKSEAAAEDKPDQLTALATELLPEILKQLKARK